ncbi:MAG: glutaredoxin family protein [Leptolyngbyaceae cyanobacterium SL_7_1]|nr:glutaredoxin family protein [Leptolyngbyaceae cyanobacterium SL_7_1]
MRVILYSKPGCHLCEGLQEKLGQIQTLAIELEIRDIASNSEWFNAYQYEIPVLFVELPNGAIAPVPRPSPRATVPQIEQALRKVATGL